MKADQRDVSAIGDVTGRDKTVVINHAPSAIRATTIDELISRLVGEVERGEISKYRVEELAYFYKRRSVDGVDGLKAKLEKANLGDSYLDAIDQKEQFVKLLKSYGQFRSAQDIFAFFLARIRSAFNRTIYPDLADLTESQANQRILKEIVEPIVEQCSTDVFVLNDDTVFGMLYWLAEQCYVRWHK